MFNDLRKMTMSSSLGSFIFLLKIFDFHQLASYSQRKAAELARHIFCNISNYLLVKNDNFVDFLCVSTLVDKGEMDDG